ncbi:MAG: lysophospholipid acyltransferase family protein [Phycisphaeraceae bacterium]
MSDDEAVKRRIERSWLEYRWWFFLKSLVYVWCLVLYRVRLWGGGNLPRTGPVLLVSNHQSYIDPMLMCLGCPGRTYCSMARSTLWRKGWLAFLLNSVHSLPVRQGDGDMAAMRGFIERLKDGQMLLVYPEGTRTEDGEVQPFESGLMLLIKRAKPVVVPVAVEGAYDIWPKGRGFPRLSGRLGLSLGEPIEAEALIPLGAEGALGLLRDRVAEQVDEMRERFDRWG